MISEISDDDFNNLMSRACDGNREAVEILANGERSKKALQNFQEKIEDQSVGPQIIDKAKKEIDYLEKPPKNTAINLDYTKPKNNQKPDALEFQGATAFVFYACLPLIKKLAGKLSHSQQDWIYGETYLGEAYFGVRRAIVNYKAGKNAKFITYCFWHIRGKMLDFLREKDQLIHIPKGQLQFVKKVLESLEAETKRLQKNPTNEEIVKAINTEYATGKQATEGQVLEALEFIKSSILSLEDYDRDNDDEKEEE